MAIIDPSVMNIKSLESLQGNIIVQILNNLKLNIVNKDMNLNCAVVRSDIKKGVAEFPKGIVVDANDFYVVVDGNANGKTREEYGQSKVDVSNYIIDLDSHQPPRQRSGTIVDNLILHCPLPP